MADAPAFPLAAAIESSLERLAERCADPTPHVYRNLFARHPRMEMHFWRDGNGDIKGATLAEIALQQRPADVAVAQSGAAR